MGMLTGMGGHSDNRQPVKPKTINPDNALHRAEHLEVTATRKLRPVEA